MIDDKELWNQVKENSRKLNNCKLHNFQDITPDRKIGKRYKCKNCNGELDGINVHYYERGLEHGINLVERKL
jgi:hypothetical protein